MIGYKMHLQLEDRELLIFNREEANNFIDLMAMLWIRRHLLI